MAVESTYLYWLIVGCEVGFWLVLVLALAMRYLLQRERLSRGLLIALPALDLLLLAFTALDLRSGATATFAHGLAAAYVGFTVAFGDVAVRWADQRFAHRFAGGPPPVVPPTRGWPAVRHEFALWLRCILAAAITIVLLIALIAYVGEGQATEALSDWLRFPVGSVFVWFIFGPVWRLVFFGRRTSAGDPGRETLP
jgi:hypothetical protein